MRRWLLAAAAVGLLAACGDGGTTGPATGPLATAPLHGLGGSSPTPAGSPTPVPSGGTITVLAPLGLNLRDGPSTSANVVGRLGRGVTLTVTGHEQGWYHAKGQTKEGWVTDDPTLVSAGHFNDYTSQKGFSLLYPEAWTFSETDTGVKLLPQSGPEVLTIVVAATNDGIGPPGRPGYGVVSVDTIEVYGVTATERLFDAGKGAPAGTSAPLGGGSSPAPPTAAAATPTPGAQATHLAEVRLAAGSGFFMRIDFDYSDPASLRVFQDILNSVYLVAASVTPPPPSPGASPTP